MTTAEDVITAFDHQWRMVTAPWDYPERDYFFMVAGYQSGKSFTGVLMMLDLIDRYQGSYVNIGVGGTTITLLKKTLLGDFFKILITYGFPYEYNKQESVIQVGTVKFTIIATEQPELIYAHNFNAFICDEIDELPQDKALECFKAIQERTRRTFPDGREPFSVFLTTAQGYRAAYQIVEEIKERGDPYYLIHAHSMDNTTNSERWLRRMTSIYNEIEQRVFLKGDFANLTTGRVYPGYDEEKHRYLKTPFEVQPDDTVMVGQDLNSGFSKGTAVVKRWVRPDGTIEPANGRYYQGRACLYVVRLWSFGEIGHAPTLMRSAFPFNRIVWYPDATGKEIMKGYIDEVRSADIELRIGNTNPVVLERIFFVNKLFEMGLLKLFPDTAPLSMALKVRQFNDKGDPEKGKGELDPSHVCDSLEYVLWRAVSSDPDFFDLWSVSNSARAKLGRRPE